MHHNTTAPVEVQPGVIQDLTFYTAGLKDIPAVFFYLLISVVMHAIIQEYLLDKVNKKLHLSKVKYGKFNESGQLLAFYLVSLIWGGDLLLRENILNVASLWEGYPHNNMTFRFTRLSLVLLVIHYLAEAVFHLCRLLAYTEKTSISNKLFKLGDLLFVLARLSSVILAVLTFWFGLAKVPAEQQVVDTAEGNFNTGLLRLNCLVAVCLLQAWMMWNWIMFQVKRMREAKNTSSSSSSAASKTRKTEQEKAKARKLRKEQEDRESDLPEVDQDAKKTK